MQNIIDGARLEYDDVLILPKNSPSASRQNVVMQRSFNFYHCENSWYGVPIIAANMDTIGTFAMVKAMYKRNMLCALSKHYKHGQILDEFSPTDDHWGSIVYTMGIQNHDWDKLDRLVDFSGVPPLFICVDVANGYTDHFVGQIKKLRELHPGCIIMAGNVCTGDMVKELIRYGGADIVKVGVGPGSACTTRDVTGVGNPQLSAIMECADAAHGLTNNGNTGLICADGGCKAPGDVCKAFGAGADFVMVGGLLAGSDECEGDWKRDEKNIKQSLKFYGMSSHAAQDKYNGKTDYRAFEGTEIEVPYKGPVDNTLQQIEGGIRSCCTYIGAVRIRDMPRCTTFVRVNRGN